MLGGGVEGENKSELRGIEEELRLKGRERGGMVR